MLRRIFPPGSGAVSLSLSSSVAGGRLTSLRLPTGSSAPRGRACGRMRPCSYVLLPEERPKPRQGERGTPARQPGEGRVACGFRKALSGPGRLLAAAAQTMRVLSAASRSVCSCARATLLPWPVSREALREGERFPAPRTGTRCAPVGPFSAVASVIRCTDLLVQSRFVLLSVSQDQISTGWEDF